MIILPWITATYWLILTLTALPIASYLVILPELIKNKKMHLLALLSLMLLLSQVLFMLFVFFGAQVYNTPNPSNAQKIKVSNALEFTSLGLYNVLYCCAHWVFAMKYWVTARQMETIENGRQE